MLMRMGRPIVEILPYQGRSEPPLYSPPPASDPESEAEAEAEVIPIPPLVPANHELEAEVAPIPPPPVPVPVPANLNHDGSSSSSTVASHDPEDLTPSADSGVIGIATHRRMLVRQIEERVTVSCVAKDNTDLRDDVVQ
ncbi:hypothetical protein Tco_0011331 [Tanacetum coccineum]